MPVPHSPRAGQLPQDIPYCDLSSEKIKGDVHKGKPTKTRLLTLATMFTVFSHAQIGVQSA